MQTLKKNTGLDITQHGLRRTFATIMSAKWMPLNHIRILLGHNDIETTQSYFMTSESVE